MKTALVTGGTTRLGLAIAERLRADGYRVLTSSHRADASADIIVDLSESMGAAKLYAKALELLSGQPPDLLVNNAALFIGDAEALDAVNFIAPKKLIMLMGGRETAARGVVVNILDTRVLNGEATTPYEKTKVALLDYTLSSAVTFADSLRVNAVAPGPVLAPLGCHEKAGELLVARPTTSQVAAAVSFLASAESTTGAVIPVDGGQHLL